MDATDTDPRYCPCRGGPRGREDRHNVRCRLRTDGGLSIGLLELLRERASVDGDSWPACDVPVKDVIDRTDAQTILTALGVESTEAASR